MRVRYEKPRRRSVRLRAERNAALRYNSYYLLERSWDGGQRETRWMVVVCIGRADSRVISAVSRVETTGNEIA